MTLVVTFKNGIVKKWSETVRWTVKEDRCDSFIVRNENDQIIFMSHWTDVQFIETKPADEVDADNIVVDIKKRLKMI